MNNLVVQIAVTALLIATAIILHELVHGYAAWALGDDTAKQNGRLSLNPMRHIDRFGTILLPGFLLISQLLTIGRVVFMFGYAKPVPVDASRFPHPRQMMALVAIAGPLANFTLAWLAAHLLRVPNLSEGATTAIDGFLTINLVLGLFNLLPIPPLDGGRIAVGLLPLPLAIQWAKLERFGIVFVLALLALPPLLREAGVQFNPLNDTLTPALDWAYGLTLRLAGVTG